MQCYNITIIYSYTILMLWGIAANDENLESKKNDTL